MRARCWCFRLSNPEEVLAVDEWADIAYAVWQLEIGEQGTVHYQGYANFSQPKRMAALKKIEGMEGAHWEMRKGSKLQAAQYCWKAESQLEGPYFYPDEESLRRHCKSEKGSRTDIHLLCDLVKDGWSDDRIAAEHPIFILKYQKGIDHLRLALPSAPRPAVNVDSVVYVGPSGTGKSHRLRQECPPGPEWFWMRKGKWWDGYQGQPGVVLDEFRDTWMPREDLLRLLDIGDLTVEKKGGMIRMMAIRFRFSTNVHPKAWYRGVQGKGPWEADPLRRRLRRIELMTEVYQPAWEELADDAGEWWDQQPEAVAPEVRAEYGKRMI